MINISKKLFYAFFCISLLLALIGAQPVYAAGLCYVNDDAGGSNNGTSWANAYISIQSAIADTCTEIWVAAGTYKPHTSDRAISFNLESGTAIYGGFAGTETLLSERNLGVNLTILSGDLNGNDNSNIAHNEATRSENSYHVIYGSSVDNTAILDGFTITGGNANSVSFPDNQGGGMYSFGGSATLANLTFSNNSTLTDGAGMRNTSSSNPSLTNVTFSNNSAANAGGGMYNSNSNPTLTNVTFSNNSAQSGGGMYNTSTSNSSLTNVTFSANTATNAGGGMYNHGSNPSLTNITFNNNTATNAGGGMANNNNSSPSLANVTFSNNSSTSGGGMSNTSGTSSLINVTFSGNSATSSGGGIDNDNSSPSLTNVTFSNNSADNGGGMDNFSSSPSLTNVTFSGNSGSISGGGMRNINSSSPTLRNVLIANSTTGGDCVNDASTLNATSSNNLIEGTGANACGLSNNVNGNIIGSDPNLGSLTGSPAYFPLNSGSPAINAGTNTGCPTTSQNGVSRPQSSICDIGSFESYDYSGLILYVKPVGTGSSNCLDWANACSLQTAISVASSGNDIWVMMGTHIPHASDRAISFVLESGVEIYGGFAGTETLLSQRNFTTNVTILSGDLNGDDSGFTNNSENSYHVVTSSGVANTAILDGFTIIGGNADGSSPHFSGAGMRNSAGSNPTLNNLIISGNSASFGGGMLNDSNSNPTLTNSTLSDNTASNSGGGMYNNSSSPSLTNVTIRDNTTTLAGGGVQNFTSSPTFTNVTFSNNSTDGDGGGANNYGGNPVYTNVTFSGNSASTSGGGMHNNASSSPILKNVIIANSTNFDCVNDGASLDVASSNNLVESGSCGLTNGVNGNITGSDPVLGSLTGSPAYFPLNAGSPAINTGTNSSCPATDQRGLTRPQGSICDIGAFEKESFSATFKSNAANDGWILEASETSNTGGTLNSNQKSFILGDDAADRQYRTILHFDTSALPDNAVVTNMTLKIKQQGSVTGTSPFSFGSLYVDMRNPAFGGSALELTDFNFAAKKVKSAVFNPNPVSGWFSARFNNGGKLYINRTGTSQLRLYFSVDDNNNNIADFIRFYSGNAPAGNRPKLLITYYIP